jgi:hypothetical protein
LTAWRAWLAPGAVRVLGWLLGDVLRHVVEETYARGYAAGRAAERAALLADFAVLEQTAPPTLH